ncbi:hypothetical protein FNH05_37115 [Amycolatopsis rhizosphaerae]|uniref:Uncharacterized protein n=1 Tax=Amycolatopsis rhizosphaerae TaxID=2053003 RepID=A0A557ZSI6_9PSEU|nr:hypothetical protein [Amycolatopsis rhizosphaerae]TVT14993.1 hypothetical protein FNH05_37115 [Amycolatopsis rhizosphaerae]
MVITNTVECGPRLQDEAAGIGRDHGWTHAAYVDAYGGDPYAEPEVPPRFAPVAAVYAAAYAEGVTAYLDDPADD